MNRLYPAFFKLKSKKVLVIGAGRVAEQKIHPLLEAGADVSVIAPKCSEGVEQLISQRKVTLERRNFRKGDVRGFSLVFGATSDKAVQKRIYQDAVRTDLPVNIVDVPELCTFYLSSVFHKGDLKIAVSTNGKSPTLGKLIRDRIGDEFGKDYPELLETLGDIRPHVHTSFAGYEKRKEVLEHFARTEVARLRAKRTKAGNERDTDESAGKVFLIGAGPGDPELITVKGHRILATADVVIYDSLVSTELLENLPSSTEKIHVGKRAGAHCMKQEEINDLLIRKAREGGVVVRLKGGDPFVFGRGAEEVEALVGAGIRAEVVPGITAGTGIPATLGIPLTHRKFSSSVVFATGHEDPTKSGNRIDWSKLASADTIVVYMGIGRLGLLVEEWLSAGIPPSRPVAVIFGGSLPGETVVPGTIETIVDRVSEYHCDLPGLIVVGETVRFLRETADRGKATQLLEQP
ncbi:MAG TPA: siroheme synthase CysG [Bacteroidota bacterium]